MCDETMKSRRADVPAHAGDGSTKSRIPAGLLLCPSPEVLAASRRLPDLDERLRQRSVTEWLKAADVIYAVDVATGECCGLFYGDPAIESLPIDPEDPWSWPAIVGFPVDREVDNLECLAGAVELIKGSCSFVADFRKLLREPEMLEDLGRSDLIDAVDAATGERCGLFFGDPATESLPIDPLEPWLAPVVMRFRVNPLGDDREVIAAAVRAIKGSCGYPSGR